MADDFTAQPVPGADLTAPITSADINPFDYGAAWDHIILDDTLSPGLVVDCAGENPRAWDKAKGTGSSGATLKYGGDDLAEFSCKIRLGYEQPGGPTAQEQFAEWDAFKPLLKAPTEKNPNARTIFYPNLQMLPVPITDVQVKNVKGPKQVEPSIWEWEITFIQYRAPAPAGAKSTGGKGSTSGASGGDAVDALITSLTGEVNDLA